MKMEAEGVLVNGSFKRLVTLFTITFSLAAPSFTFAFFLPSCPHLAKEAAPPLPGEDGESVALSAL